MSRKEMFKMFDPKKISHDDFLDDPRTLRENTFGN